MNHANLVGVARLPNNLFTDNAGTEVGSDLIILQKNSGKNGELYYNEKLFVQTEQTPIGTSVNGYVWSIGSLSHTDLIRSTDPYGKPAYKPGKPVWCRESRTLFGALETVSVFLPEG